MRAFIKKYILGRYVNSGVIASIDLLISTVSTTVSLICINLILPDLGMSLKRGVMITGAAIVATVIAMAIMKTYRIIIRHSTFFDIWKFAVAVFIKEILTIIAIAIILPRIELVSFVVLDMLATFSALVCIRITMIKVYDILKHSIVSYSKRTSIFIYGTSDKSTALKIRLANSPHYNVLGFIQYDAYAANSRLLGVNVFSLCNRSKEEIKTLFDKFEVTAVLFPNYDSLKKERERLVDICSSQQIKILVAPPIDEAVDGKVQQSGIRAIKIEDLLERDEIKISMKEIVDNFNGKRILVTGAAGSIGSELCRQLASFGIDKLILFDNAETPLHNIRLELENNFPALKLEPVIGDVRQEARLDFVFREHKPQIVFHAAAYKHVPLMEENPCEAVCVNVVGSRNVADMCVRYGIEMMVMISTDKAVNPTNIMGCSKRLAEIYVQSLGKAISDGKVKCNGEAATKFVTTRFGNVLGSNGSVIPRFREQIMNGGPVTVTHPEITRFFMTIPEACRLVMEAATMSHGNQIFVFDMGESVKIVNLARRMIELSGFEVDKDIKIVFTGLRPGEKLYEEVLANAENTQATPHEKICIANVREYNYDDATVAVEQLNTLARNVQITELVTLMKAIVPEFKSQNSVFASLDK